MLCLFLAAALLFCGCTAGAASTSEPEVVGGSTKRDAVRNSELQFVWPADDAVFATLETSRGDIRLVLYPDIAPLAVENFCTLALLGYYDGTEFHRVMADFVIQGGDATGTGTGGASIWGAVYDTERTDLLHHYSGALCAASVNGKSGTHNSQFYIVATPQDGISEASLEAMRAAGMRDEVVEAYRQAGGAPYLDHTDTVFGQVVEGMDIVDRIAALAVDEETQRPKNAVVIEKVTIENYPPAGFEKQRVNAPPTSLPSGDDDTDGGDELG
ncbi:peptidylprolyl isomerase [Ruminococcaceae bacterium OttesenSCG-928-A11]|nr:peptidylprolyl isomerase [Ruminococcaceae bacterium OttesenSCG-928-A11]